MDTGRLIRDLRIRNNWTQEELGEKLGVKKSAIAKYESGRVENLKRSTISKLSELFNISPLCFLGFEETKYTVEYSPQEQHLVNNYGKLNSLGKDRLIETSDDMVSNKKYTDKASVSKKNA